MAPPQAESIACEEASSAGALGSATTSNGVSSAAKFGAAAERESVMKSGYVVVAGVGDGQVPMVERRNAFAVSTVCECSNRWTCLNAFSQ